MNNFTCLVVTSQKKTIIKIHNQRNKRTAFCSTEHVFELAWAIAANRPKHMWCLCLWAQMMSEKQFDLAAVLSKDGRFHIVYFWGTAQAEQLPLRSIGILVGMLDLFRYCGPSCLCQLSLNQFTAGFPSLWLWAKLDGQKMTHGCIRAYANKQRSN